MDFSEKEFEDFYEEFSEATEGLRFFLKKLEISEVVRMGDDEKLLKVIFDSGVSGKLSCIKFLVLVHEFWGVDFKLPCIDDFEMSADTFLIFEKIKKVVKREIKKKLR